MVSNLKLMIVSAVASAAVFGGSSAQAEGTVAPSAPDLMNKTLPTRPYGNKSMWFQYLSAGEEAARKHDNSLAKRYWIGSLKALEDAPSPQQGNALFLVQMSSLERHLISTYSTTLGLKDLESEERVKLTGEQVDVYDRMTRLNKKFAQPTDLLVTKSQERADQARADLEKAKEAAKADSEPK